MDKQAIQQEALSKAVQGQSFANYPAIFQGFMARGIPESEIRPRDNVFTFNAWRALGRTVRKGEHGVRVITFVDCTKKDAEKDPETGETKARSFRRPWTTTVFHVSQTEPLTGVQS